MLDDHLQHAGSTEIPRTQSLPKGTLIFQPLSEPAPENLRLPVVRDAMWAQFALMQPGQCVEVNRVESLVRNYVYRFRVETGRREWRFRLRKAGGDSTRVWRVNDEPQGEAT